jgi:hypothetical protein
VKSVLAKSFETGVPDEATPGAQALMQLLNLFLYIICIVTQFNRSDDQWLEGIPVP